MCGCGCGVYSPGRLHPLGQSPFQTHPHLSISRTLSPSLENSHTIHPPLFSSWFHRGLAWDSRRIRKGASPHPKLRVDTKIKENNCHLLPRARREPQSKVSGPHRAISTMGKGWDVFVGSYICVFIKFGWKCVSWLQVYAWFMKLNSPCILDWLIVIANMWNMLNYDHALLGFS